MTRLRSGPLSTWSREGSQESNLHGIKAQPNILSRFIVITDPIHSQDIMQPGLKMVSYL